MKFKKIEKNILICSLSVVGLGAVIGTTLAITNEFKNHKDSSLSNNNQIESNKIFSGTILTKSDVKEIGWDKKTTISLNDWKKQAPKVTQIGDENTDLAPFYANTLLNSIEIPSQITNISNSSFYSANSLKKVTFENNSSLVSVGKKAFNNSAIEEIAIPQSVKSIGEDAFRNISSLSSNKISLPEELKKSEDPLYGFTEDQWKATQTNKFVFNEKILTREGATSLGWRTKTEITLDDWKNAPNVTEISIHNEGNSTQAAFAGVENLVKITIPARITKINGFSFDSASLREIVFEQGSRLTDIRKSAFVSSRLTKIQIPVGVRRIEDGAFALSKLTSLQVPNTVVSIGNNSFQGTNTTLTGANIKMPISLITTNPRYGFTSAQVRAIQWTSQFLNSNLDKSGVARIGWDKRNDITLYDWANEAPNVVRLLGTNITSDPVGSKSAFSSVTTLKSIQIPDKITNIDFASFWGTTNLRTVTFGPNSQLAEIGNFAFNRSGINNIVIPKTTTKIGTNAFANTTSLRAVTFAQDATIKRIDNEAFQDSTISSIVVPNVSGLTIGTNVFSRTFSLQGSNVTMPDSLRGNPTSTPKYGFTPTQWAAINWGTPQFSGNVLTKELVQRHGWDQKERITLEDWRRDFPNVTQLGDPSINSGVGREAPFSFNNVLKSIVIPAKVTKFNFAAFHETSKLESVSFENGSQFKEVGNYSFRLSSIKNMILPNGATTIGVNAFQESQITNITLPDTLTSIGNNSFEKATNLSFIRIPRLVRTLGTQVFKDTPALQTITFAPESILSSLGQETFWSSGITSITIPKSVRSIGRYTFLRTHFLRSFTFESGSQLTTLGHRPFQNTGFSHLVLPITLVNVAPEAFTNSNFSITHITMSSKLRGASLVPRFGMTPSQWNNITWVVERFNGETLTRNDVINLDWYGKESIPITEWQKFAPNVKNLGANATSGSDSPFARLTTLKSIVIPKTVININYQAFFQTTALANIVFEDGSKLTSIGKQAFDGAGLKAITVPDSVTTIAADAFTNTVATLTGASISMSSRLRKGSTSPFYGFTPEQWNSINWRVVKFEGTVLTRSDVINLNWHTKAEITQGDWTTLAPFVTKISNAADSGDASASAFYNNTTLTKIFIPSKITEINYNSFGGTTNLRTVNFGANSQLTTIGNSAFKLSGILAINIPDKTKIIGYSAFEDARSLVTVAFTRNSELDALYGRAFYEARALREIILPEKTKSIAEHAFWNAKALRKVYIPNSVTTIGTTPFNGTDALNGDQVSMLITWRGTPPETPKFGFTRPQWNNIAWRVVPFDGTTLNKEDVIKLGWDLKTSITLADWQNDAPRVTEISTTATAGEAPTAAFINNTKLRTIVIPDAITKINFGSFKGTTQLQTVTFGAGSTLSIIEPSAFRQSSINSITIPTSVTQIGSAAFQESSTLRSVTFAPNSQLTTIGQTAFDGTGISAINVPTSVTSIGDNAFRNTASLQGASVSMDVSLRKNPAEVKYGFLKSQWDAIAWRGNVTLADSISSFRINFTEGQNIVSLPALVSKASDAMSAEAKYANLSLQFAVGTSTSNLIAQWGSATEVKAAIAEYAKTNSISKSQINIYAKMYLPSATGSLENQIGGVTYVWNKEPIQIYSSETGIIANVFTNPGSTTTLNDKFIRSYSKVADNWASSLTAGGNKSSEVRVTSNEDLFNISTYTGLGIKLEVNPTANDTSWTTVSAFGTEPFNASATNKMRFRLSVIDPKLYEMIGNATIIETTNPAGTITKVIEKDIVAKIELPGISAANLITDKIVVAGSTHNLSITEDPTLYTASELSLEEAKKAFEIKYSHDGTNYLNATDFIAQLKTLRGEALNSLVLANFKVRYEFTAAGLLKYYSTQVANDPEATDATKTLNTENVQRTIDVTSAIEAIPNIQISGTTENISWSGNGIITALKSLVKVEYGRYVRGTDGALTYEWSETVPTSLYITTAPAGQTDYPLAIRFTPKTEDIGKVQIGSIATDSSFIAANQTKGYEVDVTKLLSIININTANLAASLLLTGFANNLNDGISTTEIEANALSLVAAEFREHVKLQYQISTLVDTWLSLEDLQKYLKSYLTSYQNPTSGIIIFNNGVINGATIKAEFIAKDPKKFSVVSLPTKEVTLDTKGIKTSVDLKEYVKVLTTEKVLTTGTTPENLGNLTIPPMKNGNDPFGGKTFLEIQEILKSAIQIQFKAPGFNDENWVPLTSINKVNVNNELYIRFVILDEAKANINLSLVTTNDGADHPNGFKLKLNLPLEIQTNSADLTRLITLTGDTKNLVIDDSAIYELLTATNAEYTGKIQLLYTIGKVPMHLDPNNKDKIKFTKEELESLLRQNTVDVTLSEKQITAEYALAPGISSEDFLIKDKQQANLNDTNVKLFINSSNYYELARKLSVKGTSSNIVWGPEIIELIRTLSDGLILQYSTDPTALISDAATSNKWTRTQPTEINPIDKFLAVRMNVVEGYVFAEQPELFRVNTSNVLLVIDLKAVTLDLIKITGNTKDLAINLTEFNNALTAATTPGQNFIEVQYYFGGTPPTNLNIAPGTEWFSESEIKAILLALKGAKNQNELILFRDSLKARYSLSTEGYKTYRLNIDGTFIEENAPDSPSFWRQLVTPTVNETFQGYINLDLINTFVSDSFQIIGSDKKPQLVASDGISQMLEYYKDQTTAPFDIYYSKTKGVFTDKTYKLFGETGFINRFNDSFTIDLDSSGNPVPIWFKIEARAGYQIYEGDALLNGGKEIQITRFDIQPQITNPLTVPPTIKFQDASNELFYQGQGSLTVYDTVSGRLVDSNFLNQEYIEVVPAVLKLQYNVSDKEYSQEELDAVIADPNQWLDAVPNTLKVGQYVMAKVVLNNEKFTMIGGDARTPQTRVHGLKVRANSLQLSPDLILTNTDYYGFQALDGQAKIERATITPDEDGLDNYLGADLQISVNTQFYTNAAGKIIVDANNIPIIKRNPAGATSTENYLDSTGRPILDVEGNPIPILTINKNGSIIPAPPLTTGRWLAPRKMIDSSIIGSFSQDDDGLLDWRLFEGQTVRFSFVARVGQGTADKPDFIFDDSTPPTPEIELTNIKYIIPTHGVTYKFDTEQLKNITFASDTNEGLAYTGSSHIASQLSAIRVSANYEERTIVGSDIEKQVAEDFASRVQIRMKLDKVNGTTNSAFGSDINQFRGLANGDILTISFESIDGNYSLPRPIPPLTIIIKGLFVRPLNTELFKNLRPNFTGALNGSGSFSIKVTDPANPSQTNEDVLGQDQWYEYQVWGADRQLKTAWTRDESKINNLVNGDKVEWKIVNRDGVFENDYYNTLLANTDTSSEIKFKVVNVVDRIEQTVQEGIGNSNKLNPDLGGRPNYPETSGWVVSGLKVEITLDQVQQQKFEQALAQFQPTFSGVDKFGSMNSNIQNDTPISQEVIIVWYAVGEDGMPRKITDFREAGLSNGDQVWATIAPSQYAIDNNLIIDGSISQMTSKVFIVEGLTTIVNSTTQTLMISLIAASSVVLVGAIGTVILVKRKGKIAGNKKFKA